MHPPALLALVAIACLVAAARAPAAIAPTDSAGAGSAAAATDVVSEIGELVSRHFFSPDLLKKVAWDVEVAHAREAFARAQDDAARTSVLRALLARLQTSHTGYYPREDPAYWELASIFEPVLQRLCAKENAPTFPVAQDGIGVLWKQFDGSWFIGGVFVGEAADVAGLRVGDEVLSSDGAPFAPVRAFSGKAGAPVVLTVRRTKEGAPIALTVVPRNARPSEAFRQALVNSWRILERGGKKIVYVHVWSWTTPEMQAALLDTIARGNAAGADGFILDVRDGWGGASPSYLSIFMREVAVLEGIGRDGKVQRYDPQIRKPAVLLVNGGTRSGKETIAHATRKHHLARLVGEATAGAVVYGQPFCLGDGSLLMLAVQDALVDGERLEGSGVKPDVLVPWDVRYAAGKDPQLERALELLSTPSSSPDGIGR